jgi:hypothetical protein
MGDAAAVAELTVLHKKDGPLTKRISLVDKERLVSDGSACKMSRGRARRWRGDVYEFAALLEQLGSHQAITLGGLRPGLADEVEIVTKRKLNGADHPNLIARSRDYLSYRTGEPALALIDFDLKGMPADVAERVARNGGLWPSLCAVQPQLARAARVIRRSTSAGLYRADTGEPLSGSGGEHIFVLVRDGSDIERFLRTLHDRCFRCGFGWYLVGAAGQLLERSLVDRVVGSPERLVFEGAPVLEPPLMQDQAARRPVPIGGEPVDTCAACPPLGLLDQSILRERRAKLAAQLAPVRSKARKVYITEHVDRLVERSPGMTRERAQRIIERQVDRGILLPSIVLPFDDDDLYGCTVADVLANPSRFEEATLADPIEGPAYGLGKAKVLRRPDGTLWINSFAHGGKAYELKFDFTAARAALEHASPEDAGARFEHFVLAGDLRPDELEILRNLVSRKTGLMKRALDARTKQLREEQQAAQLREEYQRRLAERVDPRPQLDAPPPDAEWLPQMAALNEILGNCRDTEPPMRDDEGHLIAVRSRRMLGLHTLTDAGANNDEPERSRLPPPEQLLLTRLDKPAVAELIERHVEYLDAFHRPVHLGAAFVEHFQIRKGDPALPVSIAVSTLPIVLPDGGILAAPGLHRDHGIVMRVPAALIIRLPQRCDCTPRRVARAMRFLTQDWLCDVATDYAGRCVLIAAALSIIERTLLDQRPAYFITAGRRGGGKTTALQMIATAVLGHRAAAAAWSPNDEERRKALFAYLLEGVPLLVWDNLARGAAISCPQIEKALTSPTYQDRILQFSEFKTVPAYTVMGFTGNNISPKGDMASRSLTCRLTVDRPDPENRPFRHPDPISWTEDHRGEILAALYTLLLGNPRRSSGQHSTPPTRFKAWWDMVGSAIEFAAEQHTLLSAQEIAGLVADPEPVPPRMISFAEIFLTGEAQDEQDNSMGIVLDVLFRRWPNGFQAANVAHYAGEAEESAIAFRDALELASGKPLKIISATSVTWRLKALADAPVDIGDRRLVLRYQPDAHAGSFLVKQVARQ